MARLTTKEAYVLERMQAGARAVYSPLQGGKPGQWGFEGKPCHFTLVNLVFKCAVTVHPYMGERVADINDLGRTMLKEHSNRVQLIANG